MFSNKNEIQNNNTYKEEKFDSFLNKTIIMTSRTYFKKYMNTLKKENTILDNEDYAAFLQGFINVNYPLSAIDSIDSNLELNNALRCLSDIEQAVIFLLFQEDLSQDEAAAILEIWSKSISRIKLRAIKKLKKYFEGDANNGN